jgi:glycopeptide antibiotics resistance protein
MISGSVLGLFLQVVPVTVLVGLIYGISRCLLLRRRGKAVAWGTEVLRLLFVCYLTGLWNLVLVPEDLWTCIWERVFTSYRSTPTFLIGEWNLVPTLFKWLSGALTLGPWVLKMLVYNFLMFLPLGFFLPFVLETVNTHSIWKYAVFIPVVVEVLQPVIGRSFDVDDLILNFAGIVVGFYAATALRALRKK